MAQELTLAGVYNIMATPFAEDGSLDIQSLCRLVDLQIGAGVAGLTILGIMGEAQKLLDAERLLVTRTVLERVHGRVPVVVGVSAGGADAAVWLATQSAAAGATAVMAAPPTNLRNLDAVFEYYRRLSLTSPVPVVVQDEPVSTGVLMPAAFLARLCDELEGCAAIKLEEAPTPAKVSAVLANLRHAAPIFGGLGGAQFYYELLRGAVGTMTGFAFTEILVHIHRRFAAGDPAAACATFERYLPLISYEAQIGVGLALRKELLKRRGAIASAAMRHPAMSLDAAAQQELTDLLTRLGLTDGVPAELLAY
ncbi:MAG: dihydrodipicolinate synthase family protein [Dehalococcoidia bacterium]